MRNPVTVGYRARAPRICIGMHGCAQQHRLDLAHLAVPAVLRLVVSISQESLPDSSRHASRHHRLRAAARRAISRCWRAFWQDGDEMAALCSRRPDQLAPQVIFDSSSGELHACSLARKSALKSACCPLTAFFLPLRGPGVTAPLGAGRFIRGGGEPKKASGTHHKYENTQLAAAVLDIKVLSLKSQRSRKGIATHAARASYRSIVSSYVVI